MKSTVSQAGRRLGRRTALRLLGTAVGATTLAACDAHTSTPSASRRAVGETTRSSAAPVTLSFSRWQVTPLRIKLSVDDPISRFEHEHPGTKVEKLLIPTGAYTTKLLTMIAGNVAPDVMGLPGPFGILPLFAQKAALVDLGPLISRDTATVQPSDYLPQALKVGQWQGKQYGLLMSPFSTAVLVYNADALQKAGVNQTPAQMYDAGKWTWNDLAAVARQATVRPSSSGPASQYGFAVSFAIQQAISYVWEAGGDLLNTDRTKGAIDGSGGIAGLQYLFDLLHKDRVSPTSADLHTQSLADRFNSGQVCLNFSWAHTVGANLAKVKFAWDIVPLPVGSAGEVVNDNYNNIGLAKMSKYQNTAWAFVKSMTSGAEYLAEQHQAIPARQSVYAAWLKWMEALPRPKNLKYLSMLAGKSRDLPYSPSWPQVNVAWNKAAASLQAGSQGPTDVARSLARAIDATLEQAG